MNAMTKTEKSLPYVCISGGSGLLGRALTANLVAKDYRPIILTRSQPAVSSERIILRTDYSGSSLRQILEPYRGRIAAFVHLAGDRSPRREAGQLIEAVRLMEELVALGKEGFFARLLLASSISVYGHPAAPIPWSEEVVPKPVSGYALEKLFCEQAGAVFADQELPFAALRFTHLFGPMERNNYMINLFMRQAYNREPLRVDVPAPAEREFLYTGDCAEAIARAIGAPLEYSVYNIGSGETLTNVQVAETINRVFANPHDVVYHETETVSTQHSSCLDSGRALKAFGDYRSGGFATHMEEIYALMRSSGETFPIRY